MPTEPRPPDKLTSRRPWGLPRFIKSAMLKSSRSKHGWTPLHFAAYGGDSHEVARLLTKGLDVNAKSTQGLTPLHLAAVQHRDDAIKVLLSKGANVSVHDRQGWTPLHLAVQPGQNLQRLRKFGWDTEEICLHRKQENFHVIQTLVECGADTEARTQDGTIPLDYAWDIVDTDARMLKVLWLETAKKAKELPTVASAVVNGQNSVVKLLVYGIEDANDLHSVHDGHNALCWAIRTGKLDMMDLLLQKGAGIDAQCPCRSPPLHLAVQSRNKDVIAIFIKYRNNRPYLWELDQMSNGVTPVHMAAEQKDAELLKTLIPFEQSNPQWNAELNARLESKDDLGRTPLFTAAEAGSKDIVDFLLDPERSLYFKVGNQASVSYLNYPQPNELEIATLKGHLEISEEILRFSWKRFDLDLSPDYVGNSVEFALFHQSRPRVLSLRSRFCYAKAILRRSDYQTRMIWSTNPSEISTKSIMKRALYHQQLCAVSFLIHEFDEPFPEGDHWFGEDAEEMRRFYSLANDVWPYIASFSNDINTLIDGKHVLDIAAAYGFGCSLQELVCVGAEICQMEECGTTALQVALVKEQTRSVPSVLSSLLAHGVEPETENTNSVLPLAVYNSEVVKMLLRRGVRRDIDAAILRAEQLDTQESRYVARCLDQFQADYIAFQTTGVRPEKRTTENLDYDPNWFFNVDGECERLDSGYAASVASIFHDFSH